MTLATAKHREMNGGLQWVAVFPNGYGASVVSHKFSYGGDRGLYELAVLKNITGYQPDKNLDEMKLNFDLCYDTPITQDVLGYLTKEEVNDLLKQIEALPKQTKASQKTTD